MSAPNNMLRPYTATLTSPDGYRTDYTVTAANKTEARRKIANAYRRDTGPSSAGFYTFSQQRLQWSAENGDR